MKDYPDRMSSDQVRAFRDAVLNIVSQIPRGRVTTYGHIATLAGWPSHSLMVGRTLRYTPSAEYLPCYRVVNKEGRTAPGLSRQRTLLEEEGIRFKANGHVDMAQYLIQGDTAVIEIAKASGLTLLSPKERNPMVATSYGTGQLVVDAVRKGCKHRRTWRKCH